MVTIRAFGFFYLKQTVSFLAIEMHCILFIHLDFHSGRSVEISGTGFGVDVSFMTNFVFSFDKFLTIYYNICVTNMFFITTCGWNQSCYYRNNV